MSLKGRFRHNKIDLFSDSSASLHLPCMITLSRTSSCCDDSLLETLHRFIGSWLSPSSTNYWSEETVCRAQIYPICSVDLILFLINTLKVCQLSAKKTRNDQLKHFIAAYDAVPYYHGNMTLSYSNILFPVTFVHFFGQQ